MIRRGDLLCLSLNQKNERDDRIEKGHHASEKRVVAVRRIMYITALEEERKKRGGRADGRASSFSKDELNCNERDDRCLPSLERGKKRR